MSSQYSRHKETKLTEKQERFIQGLIEHKDMVRAYQEAYETGNLRKAGILKKASDLLDHPFIQRKMRH
jgi:hypothetical protein